MTCTASDIINLAKKEIGTVESGANNVKYNTEYYGGKVKGTQFDWCVVFIWWLFKKAKSSKIFCNGVKTAYVPYVQTWARENGLNVATPKAGDIIIYDWSGGNGADHIGVCESATPDTVTCIEGNTTGNKGEGVYRKTRALGLVSTIIRPKYNADSSTASDFDIAKKVIHGVYGNGNSRKTKLTAMGYNYNRIQEIVNALLSNRKNETIAEQVIAGKWGNGSTRKKKLENAGYDYDDIQCIVNAMLR